MICFRIIYQSLNLMIHFINIMKQELEILCVLKYWEYWRYQSLIPSLIFFCSGCIIVLQFLSQFIKSGGSDMLFHLTQPQHDRFTVTGSTSWKHAFSLRHVSPRTTRLVSPGLSLMNYSGLPQNFLNEEPLKFLFDQINLINLIRKMIPL